MKKPGRKASAELQESRNVMEQYAAEPSPEDATVTPMDADGVPVLRIVPSGGSADAAVLQFHGGAYRRGSPRVFAAQLAKIAKAAGGVQLFSVKYRLAPENPFPAALDDAVHAYRWILKSFSPERIIIWGDSAGGGVAAALMLRIAELGLPKPRAAVLFSPWVDLRVTASSFVENAQTDTLFSAEKASEAADEYLDGQDATGPLLSPVLGSWAGQPPLLVFVSELEVLRDDSLLLARTAAEAGVSVQLESFEGPQHIWPIIEFPSTEDSVRAVELVRAFMAGQLQLVDLNS